MKKDDEGSTSPERTGRRAPEITRRELLKAGAATGGAALAAAAAARVAAAAQLDALPYDEYARYDGIGLAELVRAGEVTPDELLGAAMQRAAAVDPEINSLAGLLLDHAQETIAGGLPEGPFTGVPFLIKDVSFPMVGIPAAAGSSIFGERIGQVDGTAITRYRAGGLVICGRTNVPELGILPTTESTHAGITRNPWDLERTAGGSSGGSAAAVAAGITPMASASDGGGSIRIPAACCGVFGLKPTRARVPTGPVGFEGWGGLGTIHAVTRSVRDSAALLDVSAGPAPGDPYCASHHEGTFLAEVDRDPGTLRVALVRTMPPAPPPHPDCEAALMEAAKLCEELGHQVEDCTDEFGGLFEFERLRESHGVTVLLAIRRRVLRRLRELDREIQDDDLEPVTRYYFDVAAEYTGVQAEDARAAFFRSGRAMANFQRDYDVILTPTLAVPPVPHGEITLTGTAQGVIDGLRRFVPCTAIANWTGQPGISVPMSHSSEGLPLGAQFLGRYGAEGTLLRLASQLEQANPWKDRRPPLG